MSQNLNNVIRQAEQIILGKPQQIRLALCCLLARGHLLIEDLPGVGKTTLAQVLARTLGLKFQRIQFTSDLLPADILGVSAAGHRCKSRRIQISSRANFRANGFGR
jgi:MoxR-like ATPase